MPNSTPKPTHFSTTTEFHPIPAITFDEHLGKMLRPFPENGGFSSKRMIPFPKNRKNPPKNPPSPIKSTPKPHPPRQDPTPHTVSPPASPPAPAPLDVSPRFRYGIP